MLDTTKTEFLELIFFQRDQKISKKYCRADLNSLSDLLKYFLNFFLHFQTPKKIRNTLKKKWALEVICFWNYTLQKAKLLKCAKSTVSEHLLTVNTANTGKTCTAVFLS